MEGDETTEPPEGSTTAPLEPSEKTKVALSPSAIRRALTARGWVDALAAAAMSWLALLCVAAVLLLAPKLQYPGFARGSNPVDVFTGMVIVALGIMRVPIHVGGLTIVALPLGALAAVAFVVAWATRSSFEKQPQAFSHPVPNAARTATAFAIIAALLAIIFRFRGDEQSGASVGWALVMGFIWVFLFAALGLVRGKNPWSSVWHRFVAWLRSRSQALGDGVTSGVVMLAAAGTCAAAALLLWVIAGLAKDLPYGGFGIGDAAAAVMYLVAFLPNVLIALISLSMGAPVYRGAQVGMGGRQIGGLRELSLINWPGGPPWFAFLLLLIPLTACLLGGYLLARRRGSEKLWPALLIAAVSFSLTLAVLGWLGEARIGAGLVAARGFARIAISPLKTFAWGMLWAVVCGWLGSELALRARKETG